MKVQEAAEKIGVTVEQFFVDAYKTCHGIYLSPGGTAHADYLYWKLGNGRNGVPPYIPRYITRLERQKKL